MTTRRRIGVSTGTMAIYRQLAREWNCTPQSVWFTEKRALAKLKRAFRRLGIDMRFFRRDRTP